MRRNETYQERILLVLKPMFKNASIENDRVKLSAPFIDNKHIKIISEVCKRYKFAYFFVANQENVNLIILPEYK